MNIFEKLNIPENTNGYINKQVICIRNKKFVYAQVDSERKPYKLVRWRFVAGKESFIKNKGYNGKGYRIGSLMRCYEYSTTKRFINWCRNLSRGKINNYISNYPWKCDIIDDEGRFIIMDCEKALKYFRVVEVKDIREKKLLKIKSL